MLTVENLELGFGDVELLSIEHWSIHPSQKVALVGANGTGKSTLIKTIMGLHHPLAGRVQYAKSLRIGYLPQQAVSGSLLPLWDEARSGCTQLLPLERRLKAAEERALSDITDAAQSELAEAMESWRLAGGYSIDERIGSTLHGLGFQESDWAKPCTEFSGGWQMRIALAKLLLSDPDIAILDEPTNHLDITAREWLAHHLSGTESAVLVVSHDRRFLDVVCRNVLELRDRTAHTYTGNYTHFLALRAERQRHAEIEYQRNIEERARLQAFIDRFGAKATKAKQAQSRKKQLDKMGVVERPQHLERQSVFRVREAPASDAVPFELRSACIAWPNEANILENVNLIVERGQRVAIVGPNGCGKCSLLKALTGELSITSGRRVLGQRLRMGIFSQDLAQSLPGDETALSYVMLRCPGMLPLDIRRVFGAIGLSGNAHEQEISRLSGGEKARVALTELALGRYNVLILDEPTNHLDTDSAEALTRGLQAFDGAIVFVSHDRSLLEAIATQTVIIKGKTAHYYNELRFPSENAPVTTIAQQDSSAAPPLNQHEIFKKLRNRLRRITNLRLEIENQIDEHELKLSELDAALNDAGADSNKIRNLAIERALIAQELENSMSHWEEFCAEEEELETQLSV